ncbi:LGFP repeat-containing protein [Microbispora sp. NPDC049125]|uniref:LGFP repeat-containing protein n=1 Tax=Microbispora sp. NPDC049125 TaxID=3154929 RepID=UPI0034664752
MNRMTSALVLGAATLATLLPATSPAHASACKIQPYGLIGDYWSSMGGAGGVFGCPTSAEYSLPNQNGRKQRFAGGQIAWSPDQGSKMIVAAYAVNGKAVFRWGPTTPFNYDYFRVYWKADPAGDLGGMALSYPTYRVTTGSRTSGKVTHRAPSNVTNSNGYASTYTFWVKGCDSKTFGDTCRQGYTLAVSANV